MDKDKACINCQLYTCDLHVEGEDMTEEFIGFYASILIEFIESGAASTWARVRNYEWEGQEGDSKFIKAKAQLVPDEPEYAKVVLNGDHICIDHTLVAEGFNKILSGEVKAADWVVKACRQAVMDCDGAYMDAICCDAAIQAAVFDEVIYG